MSQEIERKFLLSNLPSVILPDEEWYVEQIYISTSPEIKLYNKQPTNGYFPKTYYNRYLMTIKSNEDSKIKIETPVYQNFYEEAVEFVGKKPIKEECFVYYVKDLKIEVSVIDNNFSYAKVKFQNEKEAKDFSFPFPNLVIEEITNQSQRTMKNYWINTR